MTTRSTGRPSRLAVATPAVSVKVIAAAPMKAGVSQRIQRLIVCCSSPRFRSVPDELIAPWGRWQRFRLRPDEAHPLVHAFERRGCGRARLVGAARQQCAQLAFVGPEL